MSTTRSDVEVALAAAAAGAEVVRTAYGGAVTRHAKSARDFATDADLDAERAIMAVLAGERPDDGRIGEESGASGAGAATRRWLVDPLCGTLNFAAETPLVAVNVALVDGDRTPAAVSEDPLAGEAFWTDGARSHVRSDGADALLVPTARSRLVDVNCDGPSDRPFLGPQLVADPAFRAAFGTRVLSTTLAVAWVAAGRRAGYVTDGSVVDNVHFAAGVGLCRAAGCVVTDLGGDALHTGRGLIAAADADTHAALLAVIRPHLDRVLAASADG